MNDKYLKNWSINIFLFCCSLFLMLVLSIHLSPCICFFLCIHLITVYLFSIAFLFSLLTSASFYCSISITTPMFLTCLLSFLLNFITIIFLLPHFTPFMLYFPFSFSFKKYLIVTLFVFKYSATAAGQLSSNVLLN